MRILAIDPGETCGLVVLETAPAEGFERKEVHEPPLVLDCLEIVIGTVGKFHVAPVSEYTLELLACVRRVNPDRVVIEDYTIFAGTAKAHIGQQLLTAKLVGATQAVGTLMIPPTPVFILGPASKGKWPTARLDNKFPEYIHLPTSPHIRDALVLGLVHIEKEKLWIP